MTQKDIERIYSQIVDLYKINQNHSLKDSFEDFLPKAIVKTCYLILDYIETDNMSYNNYAFSINYYSEQFRGQRFDIVLDGKPIRTFIFKKSPETCSEYDYRDSLVLKDDKIDLLNIFYSNYKDGSFSLKDYFVSEKGKEVKYISFDPTLRHEVKIVKKGFKEECHDEIFKINDFKEFRKNFSIDNITNYQSYFEYLNIRLKERKFLQYNFAFSNTITQRNFGNMVLTTSIVLKDEILDLIYFIGDYIISRIAEIDYNISIKRESLKSAIASIMSRNLSHNIGSHVITNTKAQIERMAETHTSIQAELLGLSKLMHYIQERQDFISVLASGEQYSNGPVNLKNHIFDYIACDGPSVRHKSTAVKNFFLDNIIKSEKFERRQYGENQIELELIYEENGKSHRLESLKENDSEAQELSKIDLSIPYGINGRQAFLTIIENFIRNSAKHLKEDLKDDLVITIKVAGNKSENSGNKYTITIYDNKKNFDRVIKNVNNSTQGIDCLIKNETGKYSIKKESIKILDSEGKLDHSYKGLKEMLICIAWLNRSTSYSCIEEDPSSKFNVHFVKVSDSFGIEFELDRFEEQFIINCTKKDIATDAIKGILNIKNIEDRDEEKILSFVKNIPAAEMYLLNADESCENDKEQLEKIRMKFKKYLTRIIIKDDNTNINQYFNGIENLKNECNHEIIPEEKDSTVTAAYYLDLSLKDNTETSAFDKQLVIIDRGVNANDNKSKEEVNLRNYYVVKSDIDNTNDLRQLEKDNNLVKGYFLFKHHYEAMDSNQRFLSLSGKCEFIEGISGGNYTHSLIRNSNFSYKHYVKIIESCHTKIAIIDERLFKKYLNPANKEDNTSVKEKITWGTDEDYKKLKEYLLSLLQGKTKIHELINKTKDGSITKEVIIEFINIIKDYGNSIKVSFKEKITSFSDDEEEGNFKKIIDGKDIGIKEFTIIINKLIKVSIGEIQTRNWGTYYTSKNIIICDYITNQKNSMILTVENKIVDLKWLKENAHFISIHYSIIEKLCQIDQDGARLSSKHEKAHKDLRIHQYAPDKNSSKELNKLRELFGDFKGKVVVHSGRGDLHKFGEDKVAFLPLSSIEWALENSKYLLTELFYNIKYFPLD